MAYAYVQELSGTNQSGSTFSSLATSSATPLITAHTTLVAFVPYYYDLTTDTGTFSISDSSSNVWNEIAAAHVQNTTDKAALRAFLCNDAAASGGYSAQINFPNANFHFADIVVANFSGLDNTSPLDSGTGGAGGWFTPSHGTGTDGLSIAIASVAKQPSAVIEFLYVDSSTDFAHTSVGSAFTNRALAINDRLGDKRVITPGSDTATFTCTTSNGFLLGATIVLNEPGASGGGGSSTAVIAWMSA